MPLIKDLCVVVSIKTGLSHSPDEEPQWLWSGILLKHFFPPSEQVWLVRMAHWHSGMFFKTWERQHIRACKTLHVAADTCRCAQPLNREKVAETLGHCDFRKIHKIISYCVLWSKSYKVNELCLQGSGSQVWNWRVRSCRKQLSKYAKHFFVADTKVLIAKDMSDCGLGFWPYEIDWCLFFVCPDQPPMCSSAQVPKIYIFFRLKWQRHDTEAHLAGISWHNFFLRHLQSENLSI